MTAPIRYQFLIDGDVLTRVSGIFPNMHVTPTSSGCTSLHGPIADYVEMRSIMARLDSLGLTIAELRKLPD